MAFRCGAWGAAGRSAIGRDCQRSAPLPGFLAGARWVVGHCVRSVGSRRERGAGKNFKKKAPFFPSSPLHVRGGRRKMNSVVQNDTVLLFLFLFLFLMYETASFWRKRAVSFECGARTRQIPKQPLIIFFFFNCIPANFGLRPSCWPRFSL